MTDSLLTSDVITTICHDWQMGSPTILLVVLCTFEHMMLPSIESVRLYLFIDTHSIWKLIQSV